MSRITQRLQYYADKTAFITGDEYISYQQLSEYMTSWQQVIQQQSLMSGSVVAVIGDFSANVSALILALIENQNIVMPLTQETAAKHDAFFSLASVDFIVRFESDNQTWQITSRPQQDKHAMLTQLQNEQEAGLILFTSGTSGKSKGAVLSVSSLLKRFALDEGSAPQNHKTPLKSIIFLKLDHIGGLNTLFALLLNGGTAVVTRDRNAHTICDLVQTHAVELLPTTPTFLNMLLISGLIESYDLTSLKMVTYGTEPMPDSTLKEMVNQFPNLKLKQTYGLTELGIFSTRSKSSDSNWIEIGGDQVETRVVDGILQIKTPSAMRGYLNSPSPFTEDGFYDTGDKVIQDGTYFRILGRESEIINVGGEKVYPAEVESVLLEMPNIREVLVSGKNSPIMGQIVSASVVLDEPEIRSALARRIEAYCQPKLESFKIPRFVSISNESFVSDRLKKSRNKQLVDA